MRSVAVLCGGLLALSACGGPAGPKANRVESSLRERLAGLHLSPRWIICVPTRLRLGPKTVYRCNVDYGDPHVEIYCAVLEDGRVRAAEWRHALHGREDRAALQRECAARLGAAG